MRNIFVYTNNCLSAFVIVVLFMSAMVSAQEQLIVTLSCQSDGTRFVTITATDGLASATTAGSTQTGIYLADIYSDTGINLNTTAVGDFSSANEPSDGGASLFRPFVSSGLNVFDYSPSATSTFTSGETAFSGSSTLELNGFSLGDRQKFADLLRGNHQGNIYFPAESDADVPNAQQIGNYVVVVDPPILFGDVNQDTVLSLLDVSPFLNQLASGGPLCESDINMDGDTSLFDAAAIVDILAAVPTAQYELAPLASTGDFFWSTSGLNQGAVNSELDLELAVGEKATLYLYYSTNGSANSNLNVGASINVASSSPGITRFSAAETLDFAISIGGSPFDVRWRDVNNRGFFGPATAVTGDLVVGLTAFSILNIGIDEFNTNPDLFLDEGYDQAADAFLFGTVDVVGVAPGTITLLPGFNDLGIANNDQVPAAQFANATITVTSDVLLGDVNLDGDVNLLDVAPFVNLLANAMFQEEADLNQDGVLDLLDVAPFVDLLAGE